MDLHLAVENGTLEEVEIALKMHPDAVNIPDPTRRNFTPLHLAALRCDPAIMAAIIAAGSRSFQSELGEYQSDDESSNGSWVQYSSEDDSSFESLDDDRSTDPIFDRLRQMALEGFEEDDSPEEPENRPRSLKKRIAFLSESTGWIPLNLAIAAMVPAREDRIATIQLLLDAAPDTLSRIDSENQTPLYYAINRFFDFRNVSGDGTAAFEGLLRWIEMNPSSMPSFFTTLTNGSFLPWFELAMAGSKEMIDRWMPVWLKYHQLWPLETADATRKEEFIRMEFDAPSLFGERPLMAAFSMNNISAFETILKWADRICPDYPILDQTHSRQGNTLLHSIMINGTKNQILRLIKHGWTNMDPTNDRGETPFYMAATVWRRSCSMLKALIQLGSQGLFQYRLENLMVDSNWKAIRILIALGMEGEVDRPSDIHPLTGLEVPSLVLTPEEIRKIRFTVYFKPSLTQRLMWYLI